MKIEIRDETFKRLQRHAIPLRDTPEDVIVKLLDSYERRRTKTIPLDEFVPPDMRPRRRVAGFAGELWELVLMKLPKEFLIEDVYRHLNVMKKQRPHVKELEAAARAGLQTLRDAGYIEFLDNRGHYRRIEET
jgi:hypothetical protein